ncbi:MAG: histidinol dehydrogenase [Deltaproteobacteria bacterium]|nr:histidinol dehydrogenase [Deltaproteobacteria bacterium]
MDSATTIIPKYSGVTEYLAKGQGNTLDHSVSLRVTQIINQVREDGDSALFRLTRELDGVERSQLSVTSEEWASVKEIPSDVHDLLRRAGDNIHRFHTEERKGIANWTLGQDEGYVGQHVSPIGRAGLYVPGGTAAYPSSVLMNAIPAQVAGVDEIVIVSPPDKKTGRVSPLVLAAARILGIHEIYALGGAQAVAALAYGTGSIRRVDKITGPGNQWVTEAKRQVFGQTGIDSLAGPSEIVIVADESADPGCLASDLLSQAEHDTRARAILISWKNDIVDKTEKELERQVSLLPRQTMARQALRNGALIRVKDSEEALAAINAIAPEHLELQIMNAEAILPLVIAGAVFIGPFTPEPVGDYWAGCNHILPTRGTARFASALSVRDFMRWTSVVRYDRETLNRDRDAIASFARLEGLEAHARSVEARFRDSKAGGE